MTIHVAEFTQFGFISCHQRKWQLCDYGEKTSSDCDSPKHISFI